MRVLLLAAASLFTAIGCRGPEEDFGPKDFTVNNGDVDLAARIWRPGPGVFPVVIIVEAAGSVPKEQFESRVDIYLENGLAVVTYDKRGYFKSGGTIVSPNVANSKETIGLLASDVSAIVDFLKNDPGINPNAIGLMCFDQGVWVGAVAHSMNSSIQCSVNIVGSATSFGMKEYYAGLSGNAPNGNNLSTLTADEIDNRVDEFQGPHGFDPLPHLRQVSKPQLWILGGADFANPTRQSVSVLEELIASNQKPIDIIVVPNANHNLYDPIEKEQFLGGDLLVGWLGDILY